MNGSEHWNGVSRTKAERELSWFEGTSNVLFWAVDVVNAPREMTNVRLAIGSNAASVWWVTARKRRRSTTIVRPSSTTASRNG